MLMKNQRIVVSVLLVMMFMVILAPSVALATNPPPAAPAAPKSTNGKLFEVGVDTSGNLTITGEGFEESQEHSWKRILDQLKYFIGGFSAVAVTLIIGAFIVQFVKLANVGDNPNKRKEITTGIGWTFVATALLGSVATVVAIAYKFF